MSRFSTNVMSRDDTCDTAAKQSEIIDRGTSFVFLGDEQVDGKAFRT